MNAKTAASGKFVDINRKYNYRRYPLKRPGQLSSSKVKIKDRTPQTHQYNNQKRSCFEPTSGSPKKCCKQGHVEPYLARPPVDRILKSQMVDLLRS